MQTCLHHTLLYNTFIIHHHFSPVLGTFFPTSCDNQINAYRIEKFTPCEWNFCWQTNHIIYDFESKFLEQLQHVAWKLKQKLPHALGLANSITLNQIVCIICTN